MEAKVSDALQLSVHFDKQSANVEEIVRRSVDAERIGFRRQSSAPRIGLSFSEGERTARIGQETRVRQDRLNLGICRGWGKSSRGLRELEVERWLSYG
jgi:hypothetical protein